MQTHVAPLAFVVVVGLVSLTAFAHNDATFSLRNQNEHDKVDYENSQLGQLFDFDNYKRLFGKEYHSLLEEANRRRLFLSNALRAFVTGVKYRYHQMSHYESVNHMSDFTEIELDRMRNKVLEEDSGNKLPLSVFLEDEEEQEINEEKAELPEFIPDANEDVEGELRKLVAQHNKEPGFKELRETLETQKSKRRDTRTTNDLQWKLRELPQLINLGSISVGKNTKVVARYPKSNNPFHEPLELASFGLTNQQETINWWKLETKLDSRLMSEQLYSSLSGLAELEEHKHRFRFWLNKNNNKLDTNNDTAANLPDVMFFDHRQSGCMFEPRDQGTCGSCYAFTGVAMMEWLHCIKTGELIAFSEQYVIDCGKYRYGNRLDGCAGGTDKALAVFIHNFGMELRSQYPYVGREQSCPYEYDHNLKKTGYIRFNLGDAVYIPQANWERHIEYQPILIGIRTSKAFQKYGGGIDKGLKCGDFVSHAMVLIGHGRQDGQEFWLFRNSYGTKWGEGGNFRLAKRATKKCLAFGGYALGTSNAQNQTASVKRSGGTLPERPKPIEENRSFGKLWSNKGH